MLTIRIHGTVNMLQVTASKLVTSQYSLDLGWRGNRSCALEIVATRLLDKCRKCNTWQVVSGRLPAPSGPGFSIPCRMDQYAHDANLFLLCIAMPSSSTLFPAFLQVFPSFFYPFHVPFFFSPKLPNTKALRRCCKFIQYHSNLKCSFNATAGMPSLRNPWNDDTKGGACHR